MKINVIDNGTPNDDNEWYLNPATVCVAERTRRYDGNLRYFLHTIDSGVWEVTPESYGSVVAWMDRHDV